MNNPLVVWSLTSLATVAGVLALHIVFFRILMRLNRRSQVMPDLIDRCRAPARLVVAGLAAYVTTFGAPFSEEVQVLVRHVLALLLIAAVAWLFIRGSFVLMDAVLRRQVVETRDNLKARRVRTQIIVLRRVLAVGISLLAGATMLMTFTQVRALGASILASAGIIGVVAGIAAQPTLGNLVAGIQIAITEPIRLDDVVVVEEEWGRVEEITLTYVVVQIWDQRRLVLPISYFVQTPFQNWTRSTADLLGSVYLYVDYAVPVAEVRAELDRILAASDLWDGRVSALQVTDTTENTVQMRALMSAVDSSSAWDLRCDVREKLVAFLHDRYPDSLPRARADIALDASEPADDPRLART